MGRRLRPCCGGAADAGAQSGDDVLGLDLSQGMDGGGVGEGGQAGVAHVVVEGVLADEAGVVVLRPCYRRQSLPVEAACTL